MSSILKPSLWKALLTLALLYISSILWRSFIVARISDTFPLGFPFAFYESWGPCPPGQACSEFNALFLVFDVVLWYLISAFAIQWIKDRKPMA
jgi:hypothetical protein